MLNPFRCDTSLVCFATYQGTQDSTVCGIKCFEFQFQISVPMKLWNDPVLDSFYPRQFYPCSDLDSRQPSATRSSDDITAVLRCKDKSTKVKEMHHNSVFFIIITVFFVTFGGKNSYYGFLHWKC